MRFFTAPHTVALRDRIIGNGPQTVLLIHDWGTNGRSWDELLSRWRPEDATIHVPDLRGCGEGPHPAKGYDIETMVDDLVRLCDERELDDLLVVGQGMGAAIAQLLAIQERSRVRRLALINPVPATGVPMAPELLALHERAARQPEDRQWLVRMGLGGNRNEALVKRLVRQAETVDAQAMTESLPAWQKAWFPEKLGKITCPVLVMAGTNDPIIKPYVVLDEVVTPLRQAQMQWLPSGGHNLSNEQPSIVAGALERFRRGRLVAAKGSPAKARATSRSAG